MKIVIWGHKLHSHTSSYVHYGYFKAFKEMGYETLWLDNSDDISHINFDNSIFLTEGQVDGKMPLNNTCKYVLHNCNKDKYTDVKNKINIQFPHNAIEHDTVPPGQHETFIAKSPVTKINEYTFVSAETLFQPWATDLLPREINLSDAHNEMNNKECVWIGTYGGGDTEFQNHKQLDPFFNECRKNGIRVKIIDPWAAPVSPEVNREMVHNSFFAPAIQGAWQVKFGYAPACRVLKNISYGHLPIVNSDTANRIFDNKLIYDSDSVTLFHKALAKKHDPKVIEDIKFLMNEVKEKHTFVNRAKQILELL